MRTFNLEIPAGMTATQMLVTWAWSPPLGIAKGTSVEGYKWRREGKGELLLDQSKRLNQPGSNDDGLTSGILTRHVLPGRSFKQFLDGPFILIVHESASSSAKNPIGISRNLASFPRMSGNSLSK